MELLTVHQILQLVLRLLVDALFVVGPVVAYVRQYLLLLNTKKTGAFSHDICAILLFGQSLRIFFWFGSYYEYTLLLQSIFLVAAQLVLLKAFIEAKSHGKGRVSEIHPFGTSNIFI